MKKLIQSKPYLFVFLIYIISIVPILYLGRYDYPQADDFCFSGKTHNAWVNTHSIIQVIKSACETVVDYRYECTGTFSSVFFFSLQPAIFGISFYKIVPCFFIGIISLSVLAFLNAVMKKVLGMESVASLSISGVALTYIIWFLPSASQGYFWYNGAAHYVISFVAMILGLTLIIKAFELKKTIHKVVTTIVLSLLGIIVGGGNFVSALLMAVIYFLLLIFCFVRRKKEVIYGFIPMIIFYVSFVVNVSAPGNTLRQGMVGQEAQNPIVAIRHAFGCGLYFCFSEWINEFTLLMLLLLIPVIWSGLKTSSFQFKYPAIVAGFSYCLVSAAFAPTSYVALSYGPGRLRNIIFIFYMLCLIINEVYIIGWLKNNGVCIKTNIKKATYVCCILLAMIFCAYISYSYDNKLNNVTTALKLIKTGRAEEYGNRVQQNIDILSGDEDEVYIYRLNDGPEFYRSSDIDDWKAGTKAYFGKSVIEYID